MTGLGSVLMLIFLLAIEDFLALYVLHCLVCWIDRTFDAVFKDWL